MANDALPSETAEKVRARIRRSVSRQHICLDRRSEGRSAAVWRSHFCVDRIAAGEIDFFSGLEEIRILRRRWMMCAGARCSFSPTWTYGGRARAQTEARSSACDHLS